MKRFLLSMVFAVFATITTSANDTWPVTLTTADGLPGKKVSMYMTYSSRQFKFDEATDKLRITVCATTSTATSANGSSGRITTGPGYAYITLSELRVLDAEGLPISYDITTNALASNSGSVEALFDGDTLTYFQSTTSKGTYGGNYHHLELTFDKPISTFSLEWDSHYYMHTTMPEYVGLTPGTDYVPYPEQQMTTEKVTSTEALNDQKALFLLEGHSPQWENSSLGQTYAGGGFFEGPHLATSHKSPAGLFTLIPVEDKKDTYKVAYLNHNHYIASIKKANSMNMTNVETSAAEIKFKKLSDGNFELTTNDGELLIVEDAYMRMYALTNTDEGKAASKRPFSSVFTLHKANISGASLSWRLQELVDEGERRISLYHDLIGESEATAENNLKGAIIKAKENINDTELTYTKLIEVEAEAKEAIMEYASSYFYYHMDSLLSISERIEAGEIPTSTAPDWKKETYPGDIVADLQRLAADISENVEDSENLTAIDENIERVKYILSSFWASRVTYINTLPFQVGTTDDALPGTLKPFGGYEWSSPLYFFNEPVEELRFTIVKTNGGDSYLGYDVPAMAEFELYDKLGNKVAITEEMVTLNSLTTFGGSTIKKLFDGKENTYYMGAFSPDKADVYGYADNPQYCYIDIKLPEPMDAFRYKQLGYTVGKNCPVQFIFGEYGVKGAPDSIKFTDSNNAAGGEKITDITQITNDGIYAIYGLFNSTTTNGNNKGAFYTSDARSSESLHSQNAFYIKSNGDGTYNIRSLNDGKYWPRTGSGKAEATNYFSKAAKVKIAPAGNSKLPNSFIIYEEKKDVAAPYAVFQDWGNGLGCMEVASLAECEKDGGSEWYIYRMTMEQPAHYLLKGIINSANAMGMTPSNDPGRYSGTEGLMKQIADAQQVAETYNYDACAATIEKLDAAIEATSTLRTNPIVEGTYVIESAFDMFEVFQGTKMAIFSAVDNSNDLDGSHRYKWGASPMDKEVMDSTFCFELIPATSSEIVEDWVGMSVITEEDGKNAFYIKNVVTGEYIGACDTQFQPLTSSTTPVPYVIRTLKKDGRFTILYPGNAGTSIFAYNVGDAKSATKGDITYSTYVEDCSDWNLRLLSAHTTSISTPVAESGEVISTTYYTPDGTATAAPVKGLNIVKQIYSNGTVKSKKIFIK